MNRFAALFYGVVVYALFFGTFLYTIGFLGNFGVPKTIDSGEPGPIGLALAINLGLLGIFAVQHSVMARPAFKQWWTQVVPQPIERSTYVLFTVAAMVLLYWLWRPMPGVVWQVGDGAGRAFLFGMYFLGIATVLYSTFLIDHFDLFGLRQVVLYFRGKQYWERHFKTPAVYRHIRHPLYVGWFLTFWMTPDMTMGHLFMALVTTGYIVVAIVFEERDLVALHGEEYQAWRDATPKFVPRLRGSQPATRATASAR